MLFGKIPQSFCICSFVSCLSCDYRTGEFRVGARYVISALMAFIRLWRVNYIVVFGIFVWLSVCTNSAYFWYRKRRIYGLPDGQKYFVYSLNVYPKLYLERFNVYFRLDRTRTRGTTNIGFEPFRAMSDSANIILLFRSKTVMRGISALSFYRN